MCIRDRADGWLQTEIFECEDGIGGECRRLVRLHVEPPGVQTVKSRVTSDALRLFDLDADELRTGVAGWPMIEGWPGLALIWRSAVDKVS